MTASRCCLRCSLPIATPGSKRIKAAATGSETQPNPEPVESGYRHLDPSACTAVPVITARSSFWHRPCGLRRPWILLAKTWRGCKPATMNPRQGAPGSVHPSNTDIVSERAEPQGSSTQGPTRLSCVRSDQGVAKHEEETTDPDPLFSRSGGSVHFRFTCSRGRSLRMRAVQMLAHPDFRSSNSRGLWLDRRGKLCPGQRSVTS